MFSEKRKFLIPEEMSALFEQVRKSLIEKKLGAFDIRGLTESQAIQVKEALSGKNQGYVTNSGVDANYAGDTSQITYFVHIRGPL